MACQAVRDEDFRWLFAIFSSVNLELAKTMCPPDFNWASLDPDDGKTVLQVLIPPPIGEDGMCEAVFAMAEWMIDQGADPTLKNDEEADDSTEHEDDDTSEQDHIFWKEGFDDKKELHVKFKWKGKSSIEAVINLISSMRERTSKDIDKIDWSYDIAMLNSLLSIFSTSAHRAQSRKVVVTSGVVDLWELMYQDSASHDFSFEARDGSVTAHAAVVSKASPVLAAMLTTGMSEEHQRRVALKDASAESVRLFLSLVYTGSTTMDFGYSEALAALDLAHRWQAFTVVGMLENALNEMISDSNFAFIAEAAKLKGLVCLTTACRRFASSSDAVQKALNTGTLPKPVMELMGALRQEPSSSKRRRTW